jgi:RHS repeat-associated protein
MIRVAGAPTPDCLFAFTGQGNVYRTTQYGVTPSGDLDGTTLASNTWYDADGNVIKSQPVGSQEFTKSDYDGLGDLTAQYVGYDTNETTSDLYDSSGNVTLHLSSNTIFQETQTTYDAAGNAIETTTYERLPTATGTGPLDQIPAEARVSYTADWYDGIGRQTVDADYGTNNSTPPEIAPVYNTTSGQWVDSTGNAIPALVNGTYFNSAGDAYQTIDPKGLVSETVFDAAGQVTETIQDYLGDGIPTASNPDQNVTVETTYTPDGQVATSTAVNPATGNQTTTYVYGTSLADSGIASTDLLRAVIYPDSANTFTMSGGVPVFSDGSGGYDRVEYQYDIQGEETQVEDQNQTIHDYYFDQLGRETSDQVTQLGSGIDGSIMRIDYAYDVWGDEDQIASYSTTSGGSANVVNEVFQQYNDWGLLSRDYQKETPGAITFDSSGTPNDGTPYVAYGYTDTANPTRLTTMTYPNGRVIHYVYNSGDDEALGRVSAITDDDGSGNPGQVLAAYTYLGLTQITGVSNPEPGINTGVTLDQFGRVENLTASTSGGDLVGLNYGHDADGNVVYRQDAVAGPSNNLDEQYTYDGMNQLTSMTQGYMDLTGPTPVFTPSASGLSQSWTLDATGNWTSVTTNGTAQDETANAANQITGISGGSATPVYDNAGNMTLTPQPGDSTAGYNLAYDAWNRLVKVTIGSGGSQMTVAQYQYDGLNRQIITNTYDSFGNLYQTTHYFLSAQNQVLEERLGDSTSASQQYVWGLRYVNDLVLRDDASVAGDLGIAGSGLGQRLYAIQDANWNVVAIADTSGAVVERYTYTAYGQVAFRNADFSKTDGGLGDVSNYGSTILFGGMDLNVVTGEYYDRARWYDPALGVFDTTDPIGYQAGMDLYEYVRDAPVTLTDANGTDVSLERPSRTCLRATTWSCCCSCLHQRFCVDIWDKDCNKPIGKKCFSFKEVGYYLPGAPMYGRVPQEPICGLVEMGEVYVDDWPDDKTVVLKHKKTTCKSDMQLLKALNSLVGTKGVYSPTGEPMTANCRTWSNLIYNTTEGEEVSSN